MAEQRCGFGAGGVASDHGHGCTRELDRNGARQRRGEKGEEAEQEGRGPSVPRAARAEVRLEPRALELVLLRRLGQGVPQALQEGRPLSASGSGLRAARQEKAVEAQLHRVRQSTDGYRSIAAQGRIQLSQWRSDDALHREEWNTAQLLF